MKEKTLLLTCIAFMVLCQISHAGSSFSLTLNTNYDCRIVADLPAPKEYRNVKGAFDSKGNCVVNVPYNSPISFCALTSIGGGGSFNKNVAPGYLPSIQNSTFCSAGIVKSDENYKITDDRSLWRVEFFAQKGLSCGFVCVDL